MSTAVDKISSEIQIPDPNRQQIRKAFNILKAHASAVANFTLQWQDLENHFQSIQNSIQSKRYELQQSQKPQDTQLPPTQESQPNSAQPQLSPALQSRTDDSKDTQSNSKDAQLNARKTQVKNEESFPAKVGFNGVPVHDGKALILHLKKNLKEHDSNRDGVRDALKASDDSGKLVLEAIERFYPPELKTGVVDSELSAVRKSCVLLLEELIKVRPSIKDEVREEACKLASVWKEKMNVEMVNSLEVFGFLLLLSAYGLAGDFDSDEILNLIGNVVQRRQAPELFRSLGLSDKASDFIQNLISQKKHIEAVRFIHAFELVGKFPPVPLLKDYLKEAKKFSRISLKKSKNSPKAKDDVTNKEIAALRSVIRCIEDYRLEAEYSPENLKERIELLRKQKKERKATPPAPAPKAQAQQLSGKKRTFHESKAQTKKQNIKKHPGTAAMAAHPKLYFRASTSAHSVHHHPVGLFEGEGTAFLRPSAGVAAPSTVSPHVSARAAAVHAMHHRPVSLFESEGTEYSPAAATAAPNPSFGGGGAAGASKFYSIEASHYQPAAASHTEQVAHYSSGYYNLPRSVLDMHTSLPSGSHSLATLPPATQHATLTSGAYSLTGSIPETHHMSSAHYGLAAGSGPVAAHMNSSAEQYGTSAAVSGRTGQFVSAGTGGLQSPGVTSNPSPRSSLAYYPGDPLRVPNYNEGPVSSSSGYEVLSKRPYVFHL